MGLQRIIKASSGAELTPSKMKYEIGDKQGELSIEQARNAYLARPLAYKNQKEKDLNEQALQLVLSELQNGSIKGTPGIDSLGKFTMEGSAEIFNLSKDPKQAELFKRVQQVVGNIGMQVYKDDRLRKAAEVPTTEDKPKEYDYDSRGKSRGLSYSFFRNNNDVNYQMEHLMGKYATGKQFSGALYDTEEKRFNQIGKYFDDIYQNEVLNDQVDSSRFGYDKEAFRNLYSRFNAVNATLEDKRAVGSELAMLLGEGSNYNKLLNPSEYLGKDSGYGAGDKQEDVEPSQYTDLGNGLVSTKDASGKTLIGKMNGETFTPIKTAGTYNGYVIGDDGYMAGSQIPQINSFYDAIEFSKNPYLIWNGKKMYGNSPEFTALVGSNTPEEFVRNNSETIYGNTPPSDEQMARDAEQMSLFTQKNYFSNPINQLDEEVRSNIDREVPFVNTKRNPVSAINVALGNKTMSKVYDISDYFSDSNHAYFYTTKLNNKGSLERVIVKAKRNKSGDLTSFKEIKTDSKNLMNLPFAKNKGEFRKSSYSFGNFREGEEESGVIENIAKDALDWFLEKTKPETKGGKTAGVQAFQTGSRGIYQLGGNLSKIKELKNDSPKDNEPVAQTKQEGTKFSELLDGGKTDYDNMLMYGGLADLASVITSFLPSTGFTNAATAISGVTGSALKGIADYKYGNKGLGDVLWDGAKNVGIDLLTAAPVVGVFGSAAKVKKAASFYRKFLAPGQVLASGLSAAQQGSLQRAFTDPTSLTLEDVTNLAGALSGLKKMAVGRTLDKSFKTTKKDNLELSVKVGKESKKISLDPKQVKSIKESEDQVKAFKDIVAKQAGAKVDDIDFNGTIKDTKQLQAKFWKGRKDGEELGFNLRNPETTGYAVGDYNRLNGWEKFVARDQFQSGGFSLWGKPKGGFLSNSVAPAISNQPAGPVPMGPMYKGNKIPLGPVESGPRYRGNKIPFGPAQMGPAYEGNKIVFGPNQIEPQPMGPMYAGNNIMLGPNQMGPFYNGNKIPFGPKQLFRKLPASKAGETRGNSEQGQKVIEGLSLKNAPKYKIKEVDNDQYTADIFANGGVLKHQLGGAASFNSIFSKGKNMFSGIGSKLEDPSLKYGTKGYVASNVLVTKPSSINTTLDKPVLSPFAKQTNPLERFNSTMTKPNPIFKYSVEGDHVVEDPKKPKANLQGLSYADVLDFTNLMYANKQTENLKQYTNYKPALAKAPQLATPSVSINGVEESNARRRIAELNAARPQYASAEQALMGKYATNAQGNEMSRQVGQSISAQLEQKKEGYRQAVNQQSMINADVANKNAASVAGNHNMQLNAQGELAKTIFQNNSNYLTRMAQNQRMKDTQREGVLNQKRALEHNYDPVRMQAIQAARLEVENARLAAKDDINDPVYRQAQMKLDSLIRMNELETEAIRNGVIL